MMASIFKLECLLVLVILFFYNVLQWDNLCMGETLFSFSMSGLHQIQKGTSGALAWRHDRTT